MKRAALLISLVLLLGACGDSEPEPLECAAGTIAAEVCLRCGPTDGCEENGMECLPACEREGDCDADQGQECINGACSSRFCG